MRAPPCTFPVWAPPLARLSLPMGCLLCSSRELRPLGPCRDFPETQADAAPDPGGPLKPGQEDGA